MRGALVVLIATAGTARADVNLLQSAPTTVAVSSTVDNAKIVPAHLVDGKLDTAWNSRTGDLVGAWIAVRVPKDAHVTSFKLTAGFVKQDKTGDLFAMNQRIKRVRVSREGKTLGEFTLDPAVRGLQEIPVNADGGDFTIQVLQLVAGSKPDWREVAVSELEVWGTVATPVPSKPTVRVGALDLDCAKVMYPNLAVNRIADGDYVIDIDVSHLGNDVVACRVGHGARGAASSTADIALVKLGAKPRVLDRTSIPMFNEEYPQAGNSKTTTVTADSFPLGTEIALLVATSEDEYAPMSDERVTTSTLYRAAGGKLVPVLEFKSTSSSGETLHRDDCELHVAKGRKPLPDLDVVCNKTDEHYHHEGPEHEESTRTEHYRWNGTTYGPR